MATRWQDRLGTWSDVHTVTYAWALFLGPLAVLWGLGSGATAIYAVLLIPVLVLTGWTTRWWHGILWLAGASVLLSAMGTDVLQVDLRIASGALAPGVTLYLVGLLLLGVGRLGALTHRGRKTAALAQKEAVAARAQTREHARFLAATAHEVLNPLAPLRLEVSVLRARTSGNNDKKLEASIGRMDRSITRLERLALDLRDTGRTLDQGIALSAHDVDLVPLLQDLATQGEHLAAQKGLAWRTELPATLLCRVDPDRFAQALWNLVKNAIRYTEEGYVVLRARPGERGPVIDVQDTGLGLESNQQEMLFQPFLRMHPSAAKGSGLGLCITKGIIEAHNGNLDVHSAGRGKGSTFTVFLSAAGPASGARARLLPDEGSGRPAD